MAEPARTTEPETEDDRTEYERFEELARKLVAVPKRAIDRARQPKPA